MRTMSDENEQHPTIVWGSKEDAWERLSEAEKAAYIQAAVNMPHRATGYGGRHLGAPKAGTEARRVVRKAKELFWAANAFWAAKAF